mmetsp:Transcript_10435/g.30514  ORF Transcript_10435/g.30514 Transcript_10435/m.30514 type:complete len:467 (+) Transcript_10435:410-1810(+)
MIRSLSDRFRLSNVGRNASDRPRSAGMLWGSRTTYGEFDSDYEEKSFESDDEYSVYTVETVESRTNGAKPKPARASTEDRKASQSEAQSQQQQQQQEKQQQQQPQSESQPKPQPQSTTISVGAKSPLNDLKTGLNDFSKASVKLKDVKVTREVASELMELLRGDKRTWEEVAVDLLRQNSRWQSIVFDSCRSSSSSSTSTKKSDKAAKDGSTKSDDLVIVEGDDKNKTDTKKNDDGREVVNFLDLVLSGIINLDNCSHIHLTGLKWSPTTSFAIQSILFSRFLTKLQLDFIDLSRHVPSLLAGLSGNMSLTCFIASRCGLDDTHLETLLGHLPLGLEELRIFGNKCRSRGLESLADILRNRKAALQVLDISFQHVGPDEKFDLESFGEALGGNETLRVLDLTNDSLNDEHLVQIIAALCRNTTLEELVLNHNKISGAGVAMMATKYGEIKGLKKISMYSNLFDKAS